MDRQNLSSLEDAAPQQKTGFAMAVAATVFFMFGFGTSLMGVLQPHLKGLFDLNYTQAMLVQSAFFSAYFLLSLPAASLMNRLGYQKSMVAGLGVMGVGALFFVPAASLISYAVFLTAIWVLAAGVTMLQVAANPFVTQLGSPATSSSRLNLAQAFNSVGTTIAPYLGSVLILSDQAKTVLSAGELQTQKIAAASAVKAPYVGMAVVLLVLAFVLSRLKLKLATDIKGSHQAAAGASIWKYRHLVLGAVSIFAYVGAEVSIASIMVNYLSQPNIGGLTEKVAAFYLSLYWGGMIIGRFLGTAILRKVPGGKVMGVAALVAFALVVTTILTGGALAMWSVVAVGLFNSVLFPTTFSLAVAGLGPLTGKGSGLINMAIVGGAVIPPIQGALADAIGIHMSFVVPALCYLYITFYGFIGSRVRKA
jgi:FHS family L-fucose permease-like MFS transporter